MKRVIWPSMTARSNFQLCVTLAGTIIANYALRWAVITVIYMQQFIKKVNWSYQYS